MNAKDLPNPPPETVAEQEETVNEAQADGADTSTTPAEALDAPTRLQNIIDRALALTEPADVADAVSSAYLHGLDVGAERAATPAEDAPEPPERRPVQPADTADLISWMMQAAKDHSDWVRRVGDRFHELDTELRRCQERAADNEKRAADRGARIAELEVGLRWCQERAAENEKRAADRRAGIAELEAELDRVRARRDQLLRQLAASADGSRLAEVENGRDELRARVAELERERDRSWRGQDRLRSAVSQWRTAALKGQRRVAELEQVAWQLRDATVDQHDAIGHLLDDNCKPCQRAVNEADGSAACDQWQQWHTDYMRALDAPVGPRPARAEVADAGKDPAPATPVDEAEGWDEQPTTWQVPPEAGVLAEIADERIRQDAKWGEQNHPDGTGGPVMRSEAEEMRGRCQFLAEHGGVDWRAILLEEVYEALAEEDPTSLRSELVQVAAVACAWAEAIDRRSPLSDTPPEDNITTLERGLGDVRVAGFWVCPDHDRGQVAWCGGVAHCLTEGCNRSSATPPAGTGVNTAAEAAEASVRASTDDAAAIDAAVRHAQRCPAYDGAACGPGCPVHSGQPTGHARGDGAATPPASRVHLCKCCIGRGGHPCGHGCDTCEGAGIQPDGPLCSVPHGADCRCTTPAGTEAAAVAIGDGGTAYLDDDTEVAAGDWTEASDG